MVLWSVWNNPGACNHKNTLVGQRSWRAGEEEMSNIYLAQSNQEGGSYEMSVVKFIRQSFSWHRANILVLIVNVYHARTFPWISFAGTRKGNNLDTNHYKVNKWVFIHQTLTEPLLSGWPPRLVSSSCPHVIVRGDTDKQVITQIKLQLYLVPSATLD